MKNRERRDFSHIYKQLKIMGYLAISGFLVAFIASIFKQTTGV